MTFLVNLIPKSPASGLPVNHPEHANVSRWSTSYSAIIHKSIAIKSNTSPGKVEISLELVCVHAVNRRSGVLPTVDAKLFHPGQQSRAICAQASGGSVRAAHAPLPCAR